MVLTMTSTDSYKVGSDDAQPPTYIVTSSAPAVQSNGSTEKSSTGKTKRVVLLSLTAIVIVAAVVTAILVCVKMINDSQQEIVKTINDSQLEIVKFSLQFKSSDNQNVQQNVESDPNANVVTYHATKSGQDVYVVNDFNKGIQTVKVQSTSGTNCFVSALNASAAMDPSQITGPDSMTGSSPSSTVKGQIYALSETPVVDRSFLTQKAQDLCKGVSVYWAYRSCGGQAVDGTQFNTSTSSPARSKRQLPPTYTLTSPYPGLQCKAGCCYAICACTVTIIEVQVSATQVSCNYYGTYGTCISAYRNDIIIAHFNNPYLLC